MIKDSESARSKRARAREESSASREASEASEHAPEPATKKAKPSRSRSAIENAAVHLAAGADNDALTLPRRPDAGGVSVGAAIEEEIRRLRLENEALQRERDDFKRAAEQVPAPSTTAVRTNLEPLPPTIKHVPADAIGALPTDTEIVVVVGNVADPILERYVGALDFSKKLVLSTLEQGKHLHVLPSFVERFVACAARAGTKRAQDILRTLKSYLHDHKERVACAACHATKKPSKNARSTCTAPECRNTAAADLAPILATADVAPLIDFACAKFPTAAALRDRMGDHLAAAVAGAGNFDIKSFFADAAFAAIATRVINDLRSIHHKALHVILHETDVDGAFDVENAKPNHLPVGFFDLYSDGNADDRVHTLHDPSITPVVLKALETMFKEDRLQVRRNERRTSSRAEKKDSPTQGAEPPVENEPEPSAEEEEENEEDENEEEEENEDESSAENA